MSKNNSFLGWYYRLQTGTDTIAFIAAKHTHKKSTTCSVQVITDTLVKSVDFGPADWQRLGKAPNVRIKDNLFTDREITVSLSDKAFSLGGTVRLYDAKPIAYDIMGPFTAVPFLQCRHSVISMEYRLEGTLTLNGRVIDFTGGKGYIEGDRGTSFPKDYAWTQTFFEGGSLMLSVGAIPMGPLSFTGIIGVIMRDGKEIRLATYLGAKALKKSGGEVIIRQGAYTFSARLIRKNALPLKAPDNGLMSRTIHESATCQAAYRLTKKDEVLVDFETDRAAFEFEFPGD